MVRQPGIDAMGCQTEIAKTIVEQGAQYVLALKGNQGDLYTDVAQLFTAARKQNFRNIDHQFHSTESKGHGRIETRRYRTHLRSFWRSRSAGKAGRVKSTQSR